MTVRGKVAAVLAAYLLVGWASAEQSIFAVRGHVMDLHVKNGWFTCRVWRSETRSFGPAFNFRGPAAGVATNNAICTEAGDCYVVLEYSDMADVWHIAFNADLNAAAAERVWSGPEGYCQMLDRIDGAIVMFGEDRVTILSGRTCRVVDDERLHVVGGWSHANGHLYAANNRGIAEWHIGNFGSCAPLQLERMAYIRGVPVATVQAVPAVVAAMVRGSRVLTLNDSLDPVSVLQLPPTPAWSIESMPEGVAVSSPVSRRLWLVTDRFNAIEYERPAMDHPVLLDVNGRLVLADGKSVVEPVMRRRVRLSPHEAPTNIALVVVASALVLMAGVALATIAFLWRRSSGSARERVTSKVQ